MVEVRRRSETFTFVGWVKTDQAKALLLSFFLNPTLKENRGQIIHSDFSQAKTTTHPNLTACSLCSYIYSNLLREKTYMIPNKLRWTIVD